MLEWVAAARTFFAGDWDDAVAAAEAGLAIAGDQGSGLDLDCAQGLAGLVAAYRKQPAGAVSSWNPLSTDGGQPLWPARGDHWHRPGLMAEAQGVRTRHWPSWRNTGVEPPTLGPPSTTDSWARSWSAWLSPPGRWSGLRRGPPRWTSWRSTAVRPVPKGRRCVIEACSTQAATLCWPPPSPTTGPVGRSSGRDVPGGPTRLRLARRLG